MSTMQLALLYGEIQTDALRKDHKYFVQVRRRETAGHVTIVSESTVTVISGVISVIQMLGNARSFISVMKK